MSLEMSLIKIGMLWNDELISYLASIQLRSL